MLNAFLILMYRCRPPPPNHPPPCYCGAESNMSHSLSSSSATWLFPSCFISLFIFKLHLLNFKFLWHVSMFNFKHSESDRSDSSRMLLHLLTSDSTSGVHSFTAFIQSIGVSAVLLHVENNIHEFYCSTLMLDMSCVLIRALQMDIIINMEVEGTEWGGGGLGCMCNINN